ncbi:DUF3822 family protein [Mesonia sp. K7]|uniref:DUF3822 family protein n=1 Tax=Mesonia sp. K7 TaxID=2218606 RepID=UPI001314D9AB|nr:DUF3822 family protein [Mesonia sp. K7]
MSSDTPKKLSILVTQDGFSFSIGNENSITDYQSKYFKKPQNPDKLLQEMSLLLEKEVFKKYAVQDLQLRVTYSNSLFTIVPESYFDENHLTDYLKFNTKLLATDFVTYDETQTGDAKTVYIPYVNINNYLFEKFGEFDYQHLATLLLNSLEAEENNEDKKAHLEIFETHFYLRVSENKKLILLNSFNYQTKEDLLYYVLFTFEQLHLDPNTLAVSLSGKIKENDEIYSLLYRYIRNVKLVAPAEIAETLRPKINYPNQLIFRHFA